MGCSESKLDDLQAVALCRARSQCLADAIRHRQAFATAQASYVSSLRTVAVSLDRFFNLPQTSSSFCSSSSFSSSPVLTLPLTVRRKVGGSDGGGGDEFDTSFRSFNNSGGHIRFYDDDDDDEDDYGVVISRATRSDYARKDGAPSSTAVTYEQRPSTPDVFPIHVGVLNGYGNRNHLPRQSPGSSFHYSGDGGGGGGCSYPNTSSGYDFDYGYQKPTAYGGYFGSTSALYSPSPSSSSRFRPPPSPPKPPSYAWDFLNPFDSYSGYNRIYTPSWSSKEVRDMEGIPDLESVGEEEHVVVKEMYGDINFKFPSNATAVSPAMWASSCRQKEIAVEEERGDTEGVEEKRHQLVPGTRSVSDTMQEIKTLFDKASMSGKEVSKILGSGKFPRNSRARNKEAPSKPISMNSDEHSLCSSSGYFDHNRPPTTRNHSSTLQKLHVWEKKLHEEVRAEEKLRLLHEKKCKLLKRLGENGGNGNEVEKIESTRALIGKLSTKIRIAIKFIDSISNKLNRLRDEEFWPQIVGLIRGLGQMWRTMSECHRRQWQAISEARNMDMVVSENTGRLSDSHMNATDELLLELLDLVAKFSNWIETQKNYSKSLNGWLKKCLLCEEEGAPNSPPPPPVFAACKYWSEVNEGLSEREVIDAMQGFATSVLQVWRQHYYERRQIEVEEEDKEMLRMVKGLERRDRKIQKAVNAVNKRFSSGGESDDRLFPSSSYEVLRLSHLSEPNNLKLGLKRVCQAMEGFTVRSLKAYEKLCVLCDGDGDDGGGGGGRRRKGG